MSAEVVVVGNAGVDTNVYLHAPADLTHETDYPDTFDTVGQSGGYSARAFARLGHATAFLGYVGDDALGRYLVDELGTDGVDLSCVEVDPGGTNRSINLMAPDGTRHSFFDGKSHMTLVPPVERWARAFDGARLAHFSIPNWGRLLLGPARAAGCVVSVDLQDVRDLSDPYRADFVDAADVLFLSGTHLHDREAAVRALHRPGRLVVMGLGAHGCLVGSDDGITAHLPVDLPFPVVDTNGAGDSLAAGFLSSHVLLGLDLATSVHRGQLAARWCCTLRGTSRGLLTREGLDALA